MNVSDRGDAGKGSKLFPKRFDAALILASLVFFLFTPLAHSKKYVVRVRSGASPDPNTRALVQNSNLHYLSSTLASRLSGQTNMKSLNAVGILIVEGDENEIVDELSRHAEIEYFEEDKRWLVQASTLPSSQDQAPWLDSVLGMEGENPDPNQVYVGNNSVIVAVIDTGAKADHPFLESALAINYQENPNNGIDDDGNGYVDDYYGANSVLKNGDTSEVGTDHGTHVTGLVKVVRDQALLSYTQAKSVEILPIRFIDSAGYGTTSAAIEALNYAKSRGAKVINASWGAGGSESFSQALYDTLADIYRSNVLVVAAAGNASSGLYGTDNDVNPFFPSSYNIPGILSVASITPSFNSSSQQTGVGLSYFSNYGDESVHIMAPGAFVDQNGIEGGVWSAYSKADTYVRKKGTSMAAPIVAGVAGVVRAINPALTAYEVKELILNSANRAPEYSQVSSSAAVDAAAAFAAAVTARTSGLSPAIPADQVAGGGQASSTSSADHRASSGGCGAIEPINPEGPFGGNSIMLFGLIYLLAQLRRHKFHSIEK